MPRKEGEHMTEGRCIVLTDSGTYAPLVVARVVDVDDLDGFADLSDGERTTMALLHGTELVGPEVERARLMADQHRLAAALNAFSQRSGYAVGHTDRPEYQRLLAEASANTARLRELDDRTRDTTELESLILEAKKAAYGDSNDGEIEALQSALDEACRLLRLDTFPLHQAAEEWAEKEDLT